LVALVVYGIVFFAAAAATLRARGRPDPFAASVDRLLADLLMDSESSETAPHAHGRSRGRR
jgi:hypothetical protein